jgi:YHS domain-containing protein
MSKRLTSDDSRTVKDPICGKDVDTLRARAVGIFGGLTYYFCSAECKSKFVDPRKTTRDPATAGPDAPQRRATDKKPDKKVTDKKPAEKNAPAASASTAPASSPAGSAAPTLAATASAASAASAAVPAAASSPGVEPAADPDEPIAPATNSRPWLVLALLLIAAVAAVIGYTLNR